MFRIELLLVTWVIDEYQRRFCKESDRLEILIMSEPKEAPYGSWKSPVTTDLIVSGSVGLTQPLIDGRNIYWIEMRPTEGGRNVIVSRHSAGVVSDVTPPPLQRANACPRIWRRRLYGSRWCGLFFKLRRPATLCRARRRGGRSAYSRRRRTLRRRAY